MLSANKSIDKYLLSHLWISNRFSFTNVCYRCFYNWYFFITYLLTKSDKTSIQDYYLRGFLAFGGSEWFFNVFIFFSFWCWFKILALLFTGILSYFFLFLKLFLRSNKFGGCELTAFCEFLEIFLSLLWLFKFCYTKYFLI